MKVGQLALCVESRWKKKCHAQRLESRCIELPIMFVGIQDAQDMEFEGEESDEG